MLKSFLTDLQAGMKWLAEEMARPMPGVPSGRQHGASQKLAPRRTRSTSPASPENNYDEDGHHHQAYDGDAFHSDSDSGGDGD